MFLDFPWQGLIFFSLKISFPLQGCCWVNAEDLQFINFFLLVYCFKMRLLIDSKVLIRELPRHITQLLYTRLTGSNLLLSQSLIGVIPDTVGV